MEGWQGSTWNPQGYGTLMDQSGMDYGEQRTWDELIDEMDQQFKDQSQGAYKQHKHKSSRRTASSAPRINRSSRRSRTGGPRCCPPRRRSPCASSPPRTCWRPEI